MPQYSPPAKYAINLLWLNKTLIESQEHILPATGCGKGTTAVGCLSEVLAWKQANPEASVTLWYDSVYTSAKAFQCTQQALKSMAEVEVLLKDIREIPIVKSNPDTFSSYVPIYFRVDLLKYIICVYSMENEKNDCAIFTDFLMGYLPLRYLDLLKLRQDDKKLGKQELFSDEILPRLFKYGLQIGCETGSYVGGKLENKFLQMMANPKILHTSKFIINICLNTAVTALKLNIANKPSIFAPQKYLESLSGFVYIVFKETLALYQQGITELVTRLDLDNKVENYDKFGNAVSGSDFHTVTWTAQGVTKKVRMLLSNPYWGWDAEKLLTELGRDVINDQGGGFHECRFTDLTSCPPATGENYKWTVMPIFSVEAKVAVEAKETVEVEAQAAAERRIAEARVQANTQVDKPTMLPAKAVAETPRRMPPPPPPIPTTVVEKPTPMPM